MGIYLNPKNDGFKRAIFQTGRSEGNLRMPCV